MHGKATQEQMEGLARYRKLERESFDNADPAVFDRFTEDMVLVSAGAPTLKGRDAVKQHFLAIWESHRTRFVELVDEDVHQAGDALIAIGRFTLGVSEVGSSEEALSSGRYLAIFRPNEDGEYELWREVVTDGGPDAAQ